jgi:hypothetical protein
LRSCILSGACAATSWSASEFWRPRSESDGPSAPRSAVHTPWPVLLTRRPETPAAAAACMSADRVCLWRADFNVRFRRRGRRGATSVDATASVPGDGRGVECRVASGLVEVEYTLI